MNESNVIEFRPRRARPKDLVDTALEICDRMDARLERLQVQLDELWNDLGVKPKNRELAAITPPLRPEDWTDEDVLSALTQECKYEDGEWTIRAAEGPVYADSVHRALCIVKGRDPREWKTSQPPVVGALRRLERQGRVVQHKRTVYAGAMLVAGRSRTAWRGRSS